MSKKIATLGLLCSLAILLGYVESLIPVFIGIPGIKLGLANLVILFVLQRYDIPEAIAVSLIRILTIGFLFGNLFSILYGIAGAAVSMLVMSLLLKKTDASILAISMSGGIFHNVGQLAVAAYIIKTPQIFLSYGPFLLISGIVAGLLIGIVTSEVSKRLPENRFTKHV